MNKIKLAVDIYNAGNSIPIPAIHAIFDDAIYDDAGFPLSKTASDMIDEMQRSGMAKISGTEYDLISIDQSAIEVFTMLDGFEKTASKESNIIKAISAPLIGELDKIADDIQPEVGQLPSPIDPPQLVHSQEANAVKPKYDQQKELQLWTDWKRTGKPEYVNQLLNSYAPLINKHALIYQGAPLSPGVLRAESKRVALMAFENYDPKRGVKLNTYVTSYMPKIGRMVKQYQNVARIPEEHTLRIGTFRERESEFESENGRKPTAHELADDLGWHTDDVVKMRRMMRPDLIAEQQDQSLSRMQTPRSERANMFIDYLYHELHGNDKLIYEHLYGLGGQKELNTTEDIAQETGMSVSQVNSARKRIQDTAEKFAWQV